VISELVFFFAYLGIVDGRTGTGSAQFSTHAICNDDLVWFFCELCLIGPLMLFVWFDEWYWRSIRLLILVYLLVGRFLILYLLSIWQIRPFAA
jgi:hypothetical protein